VSKDVVQARKWWQEAALQGIAPWRYAGGDDNGGDADEVEQWWRYVARNGNADLQSCMGEFYHFGHGVLRDDGEALKWYRQAAGQGDLVAMKRVAWLQATCPNPSLRNGTNAVEYARKALAAAGPKDAVALDTLAAAYAEAGQFDQAIRTEKQAIDGSKREADQKEYQARLKLYQNKKPYRAELD
jgi:TPR repeat protein